MESVLGDFKETKIDKKIIGKKWFHIAYESKDKIIRVITKEIIPIINNSHVSGKSGYKEDNIIVKK